MRKVLYIMLLCACFQPTLSHADSIGFMVEFDIGPLVSHPAGPFYFAFDLINGDLVSNNFIILKNFNFGGIGAGPADSPTLFGGASGDLSSVVILNDSDFLNSFTQKIEPGISSPSHISFVVSMTTNYSGGIPDSFAFYILDRDLNPIPTMDPMGTDALIVIDINSTNPLIQTFATDPNRSPVAGGAPIIMSAPLITPEPSVLLMFLISGLLFNYSQRRNKQLK